MNDVTAFKQKKNKNMSRYSKSVSLKFVSLNVSSKYV